jgi:FKBP-type peptidyl-prolyl cis-trans isomerase
MKLHPILHAAAVAGLAFTVTSCRKPAEEPVTTAPAPSSPLLDASAPGTKAAAAPAPEAKADTAFDSVEQKVSYGIGYNIGSNMAADGSVAFDLAAVQAGLADGLKGAPARVDQAALQAAIGTLQERQDAANTAAAEENLAAANAFLSTNRARPEVTTTASGLQYEVLRQGDGPKPKSTDVVRVHYHGTLTDGTVFDSSVDRGEPLTFPVDGVIPGWTEALQLMAVGSKWKLFISPELGYGPRPAGKIPPNSALIFDVELLGIEAAAPGAEGAPAQPAG